MQRTNPGKRKAPLRGDLNRRVRARREDPEPEQFDSSSQSNDASDDDEAPKEVSSSKIPKRTESQSGSVSDSEDLDSQDDGGDSEASEDESEPEPEPAHAVAQVSFGALAKAQASLPSKKKRGAKDDSANGDDSDRDSADGRRTKEDYSKSRKTPIPARAHKHAPTEQSSKRAVTRRREIIPQTIVKSRDPRFDSTAGEVDNDRFRKAYGFLDTYRDDELAVMKRTLRDATAAAKPGAVKRNKKLKDAPVLSEHEREKLKREIASIESRKATQAAKDRHRELLDEHRKQEKELVKQGKTPFYLKKAEQKKQVLVDRFAGMKKGQVDKAIERKRKKVVSKERRDMPWARRTTT
ncbi:ribosomal RNA-processing protein 36 [Microdochium nivale]|nr:ribosomal RNA-processing protein 36 [Microdochium nivale]